MEVISNQNEYLFGQTIEAECLLRFVVLHVLCSSECVCLCTGRFVMVPLNLSCLFLIDRVKYIVVAN